MISKISYLELWRLSCLCHFGRGHYGDHSNEIILNLDLWFFGVDVV